MYIRIVESVESSSYPANLLPIPAKKVSNNVTLPPKCLAKVNYPSTYRAVEGGAAGADQAAPLFVTNGKKNCTAKQLNIIIARVFLIVLTETKPLMYREGVFSEPTRTNVQKSN